MKITALASFICAASLALSATAQSTTAQQVNPPVSVTKVPTPATTPAATTKAPTPASTLLATNKAAPNCVKVSVEGDATYCVTGPVCGGAGKSPTGKNCPKKGDVAVESCLKTLKSYVDVSKCVAPVDAECRAVKTGVWGCAWPTTATVSSTSAATTKGSTPAMTPATTTKSPSPVTTPLTTPKAMTPASTTKSTTPAPTLRVDAASGGHSGSQEHQQLESHTSQKVSFQADGANASDSEGDVDSSGGSVAAGSAAAVATCAVVGAALYKKRKSAKREAYDAALGTPIP